MEESATCNLQSSKSLNLEQLITKEMFSSLMSDFNQQQSRSRSSSGGYKTAQERTTMSMDDFRVAIAKQLRMSPDDRSIVELCNKVRQYRFGISPVYTRVLTRTRIQPGFASSVPTHYVTRVDSTHIHWWTGTRFVTGSELKPG